MKQLTTHSNSRKLPVALLTLCTLFCLFMAKANLWQQRYDWTIAQSHLLHWCQSVTADSLGHVKLYKPGDNTVEPQIITGAEAQELAEIFNGIDAENVSLSLQTGGFLGELYALSTYLEETDHLYVIQYNPNAPEKLFLLMHERESVEHILGDMYYYWIDAPALTAFIQERI
ncbi:hypothetical protein RFF05_18125 [Bengtsoniella intestinalis]|uniref:hypothetical protein n=1 Tax=Bengtsoniella intestinalis TaxID=3073143 RepID=UPI00391F7066